MQTEFSVSEEVAFALPVTRSSSGFFVLCLESAAETPRDTVNVMEKVRDQVHLVTLLGSERRLAADGQSLANACCSLGSAVFSQDDVALKL